jgi:hypothetical protein
MANLIESLAKINSKYNSEFFEDLFGQYLLSNQPRIRKASREALKLICMTDSASFHKVTQMVQTRTREMLQLSLPKN